MATHPLVAYISLVGVDAQRRPRVLCRWPQVDRSYLPHPPGIAAFALAAGAWSAAPRGEAPPEELELTAALTLEDGTRIHAASLTFFEQEEGGAWAPCALCLLSHVPLLEQLLSALRTLRAATLRGAAEARLVARALLRLPMPLPGVELRIRLGAPTRWTTHVLRATPTGAPPILGISLYGFVHRVGVEVAITAVEVLLSELRLAVVSASDRWLGEAAEAVLALLRPLEWPHTYIPLLPSAWHQYLEAPCPFLIGLLREGAIARARTSGAGEREEEEEEGEEGEEGKEGEEEGEEEGEAKGEAAGARESRAVAGAIAADAEDEDENASAIPEDVCVLNLDLGTLQVPPLEPLERFPPLERAWLVRQMAEWLASPPRLEESTDLKEEESVPGAATDLHESVPGAATDLNESVPGAAAAVAASARSAAVDAHNGALQRVWRTHWLGLLGGSSAYLIDGGTDVDVGAWVQAAQSDRRPFLRKLASSAPFHRWLEKVERGEEPDELGQPRSSVAAAAAAAASSRTPTSPSDPTGTGIGALLATAGAMADSPVGAVTGAPSPTAQPTPETAPSSRQLSLSPGDEARDGARLMERLAILELPSLAILELPDNLCEQPEALHETLGTSPAHHVLDHWGIPVTPPPATLEPPPNASTARVLGTALTQIWETLEWDVDERRDERDSSAVLLRACKAAVSAAPTLIPLHLMHARELLRASAPVEALSVLQAAQEQLERQHSSRQRQRGRAHKRRGKCNGPSILDVRASSTTDLLKPLGAGKVDGMERAPQDATLLVLVSQCLARLDARQMAELATLRFTSPSASPHTPTPSPPSTHQAAPASQPAEWRAKLRSTLSDVAAAAAAAGGGIHQRSGAMLPLGIHAGAPASHPSPAASSPQRQPLLAVWARAYLEGQAQREAQLHAEACEDCGTGDDDDDDDDADRNGGGGGGESAPGAFLERWQSIGAQQRGAFSLGLRSLAEPTGTDTSGAATGPPPGWGLGIPWAWGVGGGGRRSSQADPVHFFRRLREDNGAEGGSSGGGGGGGR